MVHFGGAVREPEVMWCRVSPLLQHYLQKKVVLLSSPLQGRGLGALRADWQQTPSRLRSLSWSAATLPPYLSAQRTGKEKAGGLRPQKNFSLPARDTSLSFFISYISVFRDLSQNYFVLRERKNIPGAWFRGCSEGGVKPLRGRSRKGVQSLSALCSLF